MTAALHNLATLIAKDLRVEARGRQTIGLVLVLGVLIVVVLGLGLGPQQLASSQVAPAVL
jgi:ABC-type transport system involved in cytochrome c biogenesis permease component